MRREEKKKRKEKGALLSCKAAGTTQVRQSGRVYTLPCASRPCVSRLFPGRRCQKSRARHRNSGACVPDREVSCVDKSSWKELTLPSDAMRACASHRRRTLNWMEKGCGAITSLHIIGCQSPIISNYGSLDNNLHKVPPKKCTQTTQTEAAAAAAATECSQGGQGTSLPTADPLSFPCILLLFHTACPDE